MSPALPALTPAAYGALLSQEFPLFVMKTFAFLHPNRPPLQAWYVQALCRALADVMAGRARRLIVNMPPRTLKSMVASVALPAFLLGRRPAASVICVSYSGELAADMGRKFRRVVEADWYRAAFPAMRIDPRKNTETLIETTAGGMRLAASVGGTLTGRGADLIVIDDPIKAGEAMSPAALEEVLRWYGGTLATRLNDPASGAIVVVMQRLHARDLSGWLIEQGDWTLLRLPAIAEEAAIVPLGYGRRRIVRPADLLDPVRLPQRVLDARRAEMGSQLFEAQYLQRPAPPDGSIFQRVWLQGFDRSTLKYAPSQVVQSWDVAAKPGEGNDWCVAVVAVLDDQHRIRVIDLDRFQASFPDLKRRTIALAERYRPAAVLIEDAGSGTALIQELEYDTGLPAIGIRSSLPKEIRARQAAATFEAGRIAFDQGAAWYADLERELLEFPAGRHDDRVDALGQLVLWVRERYGERRNYAFEGLEVFKPGVDPFARYDDGPYGEEGYLEPVDLVLP